MKIGDRVAHKDGSIGHVESIDNDPPEFMTADVRWLTPNNEPSCCVSLCKQDHLTVVPNHVVPMKRNAEWWEKSREFCSGINAAIISMLNEK